MDCWRDARFGRLSDEAKLLWLGLRDLAAFGHDPDFLSLATIRAALFPYRREDVRRAFEDVRYVAEPWSGIGIVSCVNREDVADRYVRVGAATLGWPLVCVANARNELTLTEAYLLGAERTRARWIAFLHQDMEWRCPHVLQTLDRLAVSEERVGLIGHAGGVRVLDKSGFWWYQDPGQWVVWNTVPCGEWREVVGFDGAAFFASKRWVVTHRHVFDAWPHWHLYDMELCVRSIQAGFRNFVVGACAPEHCGGGERVGRQEAQAAFAEKWAHVLPLRVYGTR